MKITRKAIFELGPEDLANVEELVIVLNPGNGLKPIALNFDQNFVLISNQSLLPKVTRRHYKMRKTVVDVEVPQEVVVTNSEATPVEITEEIEAVTEKLKETVSEPFIRAITAEESDFLPSVPVCEKIIPFRNTKIAPYTMAVTHDSLESFIKKFIYNKKSAKLFEDKIYAFFINERGSKFELKTINAFCAGLWMIIDPYGFKEACGGKKTFQVIEFAFRDIRKQLEERVMHAYGHIPVKNKPVKSDKRKERLKRTN